MTSLLDEHRILALLGRAPREGKAAFAAASAQRLAPLFRRYCVTAKVSGAEELESVLDFVWRAVSGEEVSLEGAADRVAALVPDDESDWVLESGYAQHAAAAVAYAVGAWIGDDVQQAVWACRQVFDASDYAEMSRDVHPGVLSTRELGRTAGGDIVQAALASIDADLVVVGSIRIDWGRLRLRAQAEGEAWAAEWP